MHPITNTKNEGFTEETFKSYLLDTCKIHKQARRALAFALIVYDFEDHTIGKILKDEDYWMSLNSLSGHLLTVFFIDSKDSYYKRRRKHIRRERANPNSISMLTALGDYDTPLDLATRYLKRELESEYNIQTPLVMLFQTDGDEISDYLLVSLKEKRLEEAFLELKETVANAVTALSRIKPENYDNHREIFQQLRMEVGKGIFYNSVKRNLSPSILFGFIRMLSGH